MLFVNHENKKELHKDLIRDREENVRFIEMLIDSYEERGKIDRCYSILSQRDKDMAEEYRRRLGECKSNLEVARGRLAQAKREYDEIYGEKEGLTLVQGEICNEPLTD